MSRFTNGGEFILVNSEEEYRGEYCVGPDKQYYTGKAYIFGISKSLSKIDEKMINNNLEEVDEEIEKYNSLNSLFSKKVRPYANDYYPAPTEEEYENKIITRYFAQQIDSNNSQIIEIDETQFNRLPRSFYNLVEINWKISGFLEEVEIFNFKNIQNGKKVIKRLDKKISSYSELYNFAKTDII